MDIRVPNNLKNDIPIHLHPCPTLSTLNKTSGSTYSTKFLERNFAILIFIGEQDRLINDLLQLRIFKIVSNHHFKYLNNTEAN